MKHKRQEAKIAYSIPLMHPRHSKNWEAVLVRLRETLTSIAQASGNRVAAYVGYDRSVDLTGIHDLVNLVPVEEPASREGPLVDISQSGLTEVKYLRRLDKGLKRYATLVAAKRDGCTHAMMVDADDLISHRIEATIERYPEVPGWLVKQGWVHPIGSRFARLVSDFDQHCGTSIIFRLDAVLHSDQFKDVDNRKIADWFGSHKVLPQVFSDAGRPFKSLDYPAVIYRIDHGNNVSEKQSSNLFPYRWRLRKHPLQYCKMAATTRFLSRQKRIEFAVPEINRNRVAIFN